MPQWLFSAIPPSFVLVDYSEVIVGPELPRGVSGIRTCAQRLMGPHQPGLSCLSLLPVACADILLGGSEAAVPERLSDRGQIHISSDKMRRQRVLEHMGLPFLQR